MKRTAEFGRVGSSGLDGFERSRVADIQRARLLWAVSRMACERGALNVTVAHVVECAGVSRRTFYEIFTDAEECLLGALEDALARASERVLPVWRSSGSTLNGAGWRERVRSCLVELLGLFDEQPLLARLLVVESLSAGRIALERRERVLSELIGAIGQGAGQARADAGVNDLSAEGVVGGALAVLHARITGSEPPHLLELANPLMSMIVLPYLGGPAARRELDRPMPALMSARSEEPLRSDPIKDAGMRLTYRTVRVLAAVAELGGRGAGPSNRIIGEHAGISDQGQISKLLARLERIGLVSNTGLGPSQGAPNAWTLTDTGRQVTQSINAHAQGSQRAAERER